MSETRIDELPRRRTARELRAAGAIRCARARAKRRELRRPGGRDVEQAIGRAFASVLAARAGGLPGGRDAALAALQQHPDLRDVVTAASAALKERYAEGQVQSVLRAMLAGARG